MVRVLLRRQGVPVPPEFPVGLAGRDLDALRAAFAKRLLDAASAQPTASPSSSPVGTSRVPD